MYKKGNVFQRQDRQGWIYGHFMPEGLAKDDRLEIKVARLDSSFTSKPHYNKTTTKIDIIWKGRAIWGVDGENLQMNEGDYVIIPAKTTVCIKKVLTDELIVQTLKIPSMVDDKVMV